METACDYDGYDNVMPEFYSRKIRRARKQHECSECGDKINPGERYEYVSGKWDGYFDVFHTCETCKRIREDLAPNAPFGGLDEVLEECFGGTAQFRAV